MATDEKLKRPLKTENVADTRQSPPKAIVDCSPLQPAISKNKEALKIKLMVRRPIAQLVDQGIIPSLKSSPALHEQRKQLERAKTGDILKAKIQQRPDRQELERRHILEHDESHVDPSLAERQRMLKKARLADQLNSQLSHRPGPLELIKKNILHTEEPIERIVKEGLISFKATSEGLLNRPQQPNGYITYEDDSQSSEGDQQNSPAGQESVEALPTASTTETGTHDFIIPLTTNENGNTVFTTVVTQSKLPPSYYTAIEPIVKQNIKPETSNLFAELCQSVIDNSSTLNLAGNKGTGRVGTLPPLTTSIHPLPTPVQNSNKTDAPGKDKNRKKNKLKPITKTRTIKFHEYKGPPNAQKNGSSLLSTEETSYQLLLKQQNCLLEYLEGLHKNAPSTATTPKQMLTETQTFSVTNNFMQQSSPLGSSPLGSNAINTKPASPISINSDTNMLEMCKLEKMKVSDLKLLLKTRNLPVSGPKPQLIERLRPFVQSDVNTEAMTTSTNSSELTVDDDNDNLSNNSPALMDTDIIEMHEMPKSKSNEELLREQQRKIDELQRKLKESQQELHQMQMKQCQAPVKMITNEIVQPPKPEVLNQKQIFKQQLEAKIQKDKLQKLQMEQQEMQRRKQENPIKINETFVPKPTPNFIGQSPKNPNEFVWNGESTILLVNFPDDKKYVLSNSAQVPTMQNILVPITTTATTQNLNGIIKKIPPPQNLHLTQIASPKVSSHPINVIDTSNQNTNIHNKLPSNRINPVIAIDSNINKNQNVIQNHQHQHQQQQQQHHQQRQHQQTLPSISNVMLNNVTTSLPFSSPTIVKKEFSLYDPTLASDSNTTNFNMIPNDLLMNTNEMDTMSPMQQSNCDDSCNSFDLFLSETAQSHRDANKMDESIKKEPNCSISQQMSGNDCPVDLKAFDDLELMELMGQQLDMDISDDGCPSMANIKEELHAPSNGMNPTMSSNQSMITSCRRELNPSLQPALQKLVFDQQQQQQQQQQHQHQHQQNQSSANNNSRNGNNDTNNNSNNLENTSNNNLMDYNNQFYLGNQNNPITPSSLHLGSMDIEYFDNSLAQFDFQLPPTTTTPPISNSNQSQSSTAMHFDPIDQQWNCDALLQQLWN